MKIKKLFSSLGFGSRSNQPSRAHEGKNRIVGTVAGLASVARGRVLIGGELVYAHLNNTQPAFGAAQALAEFVDQPSREVYSGWRSRFSRTNSRVRVHVHRLAVSNNKLRVGFLLDGYLAWGRKKAKGKVALLGGMALPHGFQIDVLIFEDGKLISLTDQELPRKEDFAFNGHLQSLISNLNSAHENVKIVMASPLDDLDIAGVTKIGAEPLSYVRYWSLRTTDKQRHAFMIPAAICLAAVIVFAGVVSVGIAKFRAAGAEHIRAEQAPELAQRGGKMDSGYIGVMNQRRQFMEAPRPQLEYAHTMARVVRGIKPLKDAVVVELVVPAPEDSATPQQASRHPADEAQVVRSDVRLMLSMPVVGESGYEQGVGVVDMLTQNTRMGWRLVPQGAKDDGKRRTFTLEGSTRG